MARTISGIYDEIIAEKQNMSELTALVPNPDSAQTLLTDLTSTSKVAVWRLWAWLTAVAVWIHEKLWDAFKAEVDAIVAAAVPGTARWYREMCLNFQYQDELVYENFKFIYKPVDVSKRIVARASATEQGGNVLLKVAKLVNGIPEKLSSDPSNDELSAFTGYISKIKFAGTFCPIVSTDSDLLNASFDVYYDPTVINASGQLLSNTAIKPAEAAINDYLANLPWDGVMLKSAVIDAVQKAVGVQDVVLNLLQAKAHSALSYNTVTRTYRSVAGYITIDTLLINYISV